jgi:hypothetical protein
MNIVTSHLNVRVQVQSVFLDLTSGLHLRRSEKCGSASSCILGEMERVAL